MAHLAIHQSRSKQIFARSEKTPLYAGILTYEYQQSVGKIPRGEPICGCDVDGYRPDTLGGGVEYGFRRPRDKAENELQVPLPKAETYQSLKCFSSDLIGRTKP